MENQPMQETLKKAWTEPELTVYGDIENLTQQKAKQPGSLDDFAVAGISNFP